MFIEGDNLEVLKILQRHYHNTVKLIYIDPPYNTGRDFVYPDNYREGLEGYLEWTRQVTDNGGKISSNSETDGRYHSNWLNMMYPRLKLARNLLTDDGVIFISIDDNEVANLIALCNTIFGEDNFVANFIWNHRKSSQNDTDVSLSHNYTLVYAKNRTILKLNPLEIDTGKFANPDNDPRGDWVADPFDAPNTRPNLTYPITNPNTHEQHLPPSGRCWRISREKFASALADNRIVFGKNGKGRPQMKRFLSEAEEKGKTPFTIWSHLDTATNATKDLMALFDGKKLFDTPKPISLIQEALKLGAQSDALILDFFAGSATTAHAVMALNAQDNGHRRFIMVQLPEPTPADSEARKAGFNTIADIARKRIELAGTKIQQEANVGTAQDLDIGFRAYKLADTHFAKWRITSDIEPDQLTQHLLDLRDSASDDAQAHDLLTEILLKMGLSLTARITTLEIAGLPIKHVTEDEASTPMLAYLNEHAKPTLAQLRALVDASPAKLIVLEDAFHGDDELKTNLAQYAKSRNIPLWTA